MEICLENGLQSLAFEDTEQKRAKCENLLAKLYRKYGIADADMTVLLDVLRDYTEAFGGNCYDTAMAGGVEIGGAKGYRAALDEAQAAAAHVVLEDMVKMRYGVGLDDK